MRSRAGVRAAALGLGLGLGLARADLQIAPPPKNACVPGARVVAAFPAGEGEGGVALLLDEDAARALIEKKLARAGLRLERGVVLQSVRARVIIRGYLPSDAQHGVRHETEVREPPIPVDGYDPKARVGYVYLGRTNHDKLRDRFPDLPRAWGRFDFKLLAGEVARAAANDPAVKHLGVFHDPLGACEDGIDCVEKSKARLGLQVEAFVDCLRASGALGDPARRPPAP